jgi:UDP-N-acetylglucosamine 2-epimerase (non-hydrolysing)
MKHPHKIDLVAGARPNFMKVAPLYDAFVAAGGFEPRIIHTGQHYDAAMSKVFFEDLQMPRPAAFLGVGSGTHGAQTARVMLAYEEHILKNRPDMIIVVGDVNSTLAGTLVGVKLHIPVAHVEAGLRSGDRTMPEEINRLVTDAVADVHFITEQSGIDNLRREGIPKEKLYLVGNVMIDSLLQHLPRARACSLALDSFNLHPGNYGLVTLHRPSNVDNPEALRGILSVLCDIAKEIALLFPAHPRTQKNLLPLLDSIGRPGTFHIVDPIGYLDFLALEASAKFIITDSGGIQEESTVLGVPCLTVRDTTERPVTVSEGTNTLVGINPMRLYQEIQHILHGNAKRGQIPSLWDGQTAERIVHIIKALFEAGSMKQKFI